MKNFHTHTYRCLHATGTDEEYVLQAIEAGYETIGFSDHTPWKYDSDFVANMRMPASQIEDYYSSISFLKEKYKDKIEIKIGLECEYYPKYIDWLKEIRDKYKFDYFIFGNHYYESDEYHLYFGNHANEEGMLDKYVETTIEGLETGLYSYLAHPDLFMRACEWNDDTKKASHRICAFCKEHNIILEYNLAGLRYSLAIGKMQYPHDEFWKIASEYGNKVIIGVDAHAPKHLSDAGFMKLAREKLEKLGLEIVDEIEYIDYSKDEN